MGLQVKTVVQAMIRHLLTVFDVPAVICSDRGTQFVGAWFHTMCKHMGGRYAETVAYHSRSNRTAEVAGRQLFEKIRQSYIEEPARNWYYTLSRVLQAYHDLQRPSGPSPHGILFLQDRVSRTIPRMNHGSVSREANAMMPEADNTAKKVCDAMVTEHAKRAKYIQPGELHKYRPEDSVWVERHHEDVLSRHRQHSWDLPGQALRKTGHNVYSVQVGKNRTVERDHTQLVPREPDCDGCTVTLESIADACDSDNDGDEKKYTAERILSDKPQPSTPGGGLYKVG